MVTELASTQLHRQVAPSRTPPLAQGQLQLVHEARALRGSNAPNAQTSARSAALRFGAKRAHVKQFAGCVI